MITRTFKLCLNAGTGSAPFINVSQTDKDEVWLFELYTETGERYIPSSGAIIGIKADGHGIANTGTVDSEGRVVITETQQMTASAGRAIYELSIDGLTHGTANFIVNVEKKPIDGAIMSDSDLSLISQAIDSAAVIVDVIGDGDPSEVIGEHVDAWLDNHPEATTTVQDGAITAPKINSTLWDKLLVNEEASGNPASFDDGADDVPVSSLKVNLEPIQTGTGDPSPSNVRPIIAANGKNMIPVAWTTETKNGVTATANADGTVTLTGTATANATFYVETTYTPSEDMRMTGCPSGGSSSTYVLWARTSANAYINDYGNGVTIPSGTSVTRFAIVVINGQTVNNLVFKPMICLASITDSTFQPYQGIMVERCGKNMLDASQMVRGTIGGAGVDMGSLTRLRTPFIKVKPSTKYAFQCNSEVQIFEIHAYDANNEWQGYTTVNATSYIYTSGANAHYIKFLIHYADNSTILPSALTAGMVEEGDTVTTYEPYIINTYPYSLGREVYGGTVDLATGVLTVTHGIVDMGTLTWTLNAQYNNLWTSNTGVQSKITALLLSDTPFNNITLNSTQLGSHSNAPYNVWVRNGSTTIQPSGIGVYELATPTTINLTPTEVKTLLGYNNISSTGTVDVIYHADTKLYVDKMTEVDNAIIAPTEETFTATRNYTTNDLVIVNDTLYKVTANIATGSAITPNSNVTATTLGALIKALS